MSFRPQAQRLALLLVLIVALSGCATEKAQQAERSKKALVMWKERCKRAGVTIHRTADEVESIFVLKHRPRDPPEFEQFMMDDPYGRDFGGESYIRTFVYGALPRESGPNGETLRFEPAYRYVEAMGRYPEDGVRFRYSGRNYNIKLSRNSVHTKFEEQREPTSAPPPRYGITYEDISTHEEREYWIAGSALRIIDLHTGEVMAERIGYMVDLAQGSNAGGRRPWLFAANNACPGFGPNSQSRGWSFQVGQALRFATQVLKPKKD